MAKLCNRCNEREIDTNSGMCMDCKKAYMKIYYQNNKDKFISKNPNNKKYAREYYEKNKDKLKEYAKNRRIETNYKYEKTDKERHDRSIKRITREMFKIDGEKCIKCGKFAECRHHTSDPIEFDKFDFMCDICHKEKHNNLNKQRRI